MEVSLNFLNIQLTNSFNCLVAIKLFNLMMVNLKEIASEWTWRNKSAKFS